MTTAEVLHARLEALVGAQQVWHDAACTSAYALGAHMPVAVVQPETVAQVPEVLAFANSAGLAVVPWGQGTQMHLGQFPTRYDIALSLAALTRVVEYDSANLTVIAEAGLPVREVYRLTIPRRQFLPLGFPGTAASLGGLLVTNSSGVKRLRYGGIRDVLLGIRVALPDGALVHFGGRVVKNVAGYDMNKLLIGSLGAFGVVVETTYRLVALPEEDRLLAVVFPTLAQAIAAVSAIRQAALLPSAITLLHTEVAASWAPVLRLAVPAPQVVLLLNYDGTYEAIERQMRESQARCAAQGGQEASQLSGEVLLTLWEKHAAWCTPSPATAAYLQVRIGIPPAELAAALSHLATTPAFCPQEISWLADAGMGQIWARLPLPPSPAEGFPEAVQTWLATLRGLLRGLQGYGVVEYAPASLLPHLDVWGKVAGTPLLQQYKHRFDPKATLNPGRFVAGL